MRSLLTTLILAAALTGVKTLAAEFVVYSVYKPVDLGNPGETPQKDYYVNMGSSNGLKDGATLEVIRKIATYDLMNEKLYKDVQFPIAQLKVIHVEGTAAIARLDKVFPPEKTPSVATRAVMVGDIVRIAGQ